MKKTWLKIICFLFVFGLYILPSLIFKIDLDFYKSLNGFKVAPVIFQIAWTIIYILMSLFVTSFIFLNDKKNFKRIFVFLIINYILGFLYIPCFFVWKNLFLSYTIVIFTFVTILIVCLESLLVNKKLSFLTIPYVLWGAFASVISILFYLQN